VPDSWSLDFALPLTFLAILVPVLRGRPAVAAAAIAGVIAVIGFRWPYGTGLLTAMLIGMAAGIAADMALSSVEPADETVAG
jgi:predicted branched-subunit amino acid permease